MQNTTNVYSQSQASNSLASKNNGTINQQSSASKNNGSHQSNIFSRNVMNKSQANFPPASTNPSAPVSTMAQILNNTVDNKFKLVNSNPTNPFGLASNNVNTQSRSNPFFGTINQSSNSANVLDIFNKKPNNSVQPNTSNSFNISSNPFATAQKTQNPTNIFSNNQLTPTFNQVPSNLAINNTNLQANQTPANLNQLFNKNINIPTFLPSNQQTVNMFSNNNYNNGASTVNKIPSFVQSSFQPNT